MNWKKVQTLSPAFPAANTAAATALDNSWRKNMKKDFIDTNEWTKQELLDKANDLPLAPGAFHQKGHQGRVLSAADAEHDTRHDFSAVQHAHARFV